MCGAGHARRFPGAFTTWPACGPAFLRRHRMDDALGLLIGLAGGLLVALAFPRTALVSAAMAVQRRVVVTATGGIGGVLAARALVLLDPRTTNDGLTTAAAALAGALWLAGAVGVTLARRRRGDDADADLRAQ